MRSSMLAPLSHRDVTFGTINVSYLKERRIGSGALQLLVTLSSQAALAISHARLVASLRSSYLSTIQSLARAVDAPGGVKTGK